MSLPLLILRPEPGASATARRAAALGLRVIRYPLFDVRPRAWDPPDPEGFDAMMLTSANAIRHGGSGLERFRHLPVYAVGETSAAAARDAGFHVMEVGRAGAQALTRRIAARGHARLFHPCGRDRRAIDPGALVIIRRAVYEACEAGDAAGLAALLPDAGVAMLHSPRAAQRLARLVPIARRGGLRLAALSGAVLDAAGPGWAAGAAADEPADHALLVLAAALCEEGAITG